MKKQKIFLKKEVNKIRNDSFKEIRGIILILEIPFKIPGAMVFWLLPRVNLIIFTNKCRKLPKEALIGLISHELSHFVIFQKNKWRDFWKFLIKATEKEGIRMEKETDKFAIRRGYGRNLIKSKEEARKTLRDTKWEKYLGRYLTEEEVKEYMTNMK